MKKILILSTIAAGVVSASTISYSTSATLGCGSIANCAVAGNTIIISNGGATETLSYTAASATNLATPSNISLGLIDVSSNSSTPVSLTGLTLAITVTQTAPPAGSVSFGTGTVTGTITSTSSGASLTFAGPTQFILGLDEYTVFNPTIIPAPNSNNGQVTIQGAVSDVVATPEPTTIFLAGAGIGLLGLARKIRSSVA